MHMVSEKVVKLCYQGMSGFEKVDLLTIISIHHRFGYNWFLTYHLKFYV